MGSLVLSKRLLQQDKLAFGRIGAELKIIYFSILRVLPILPANMPIFIIYSMLFENLQPMTSQEKPLDILCIGELRAGKSYFLRKYSQDEDNATLHSSYTIFGKKVDGWLVNFHELSEQEEIYLEKLYHGVIFFVDLVSTWNVKDKILDWMELYSRLTGLNVFKIPLRIIITQSKPNKNYLKWRLQIEKELSTLINTDQIIYFDGIQSVEAPLQLYFHEVAEGKAEGIKSTYQNNFRLYGVNHFLKLMVMHSKLTFFRGVDVAEKYIRKRLKIVSKKQHGA